MMGNDQKTDRNNDGLMASLLDGDLKASQLHPDQAFDRVKYRNRSM